MSNNPDIRKSLAMAKEYAEFAPGKLVKKDMAIDGDAGYETFLKQDMMTRFLFPQFAVDASQKERFLGRILLSSLIFAAADSGLDRENIEKRRMHELKWNDYLASNVQQCLTPFQLQLVQECFGVNA